MQEQTISIADYSHNFWIGCHKISDGCKFCYMYREQGARGIDASEIKRVSNQHFNKPKKFTGRANIFANSYSDFFLSDADDWRDDAWKVIRSTPQHIWTLITKRPENIKNRLPQDWGNGYSNVILGVTVESQDYLYRTDILRNIQVKSRMIMFEPLLFDINDINFEGFDWIIIGGESGNDYGAYKYRECRLEWIRNIIRQSNNSGVSIYVKQLGTYLAKHLEMSDTRGYLIDEFPADMRIRDYPEIILNNQELPGLFN